MEFTIRSYDESEPILGNPLIRILNEVCTPLNGQKFLASDHAIYELLKRAFEIYVRNIADSNPDADLKSMKRLMKFDELGSFAYFIAQMDDDEKKNIDLSFAVYTEINDTFMESVNTDIKSLEMQLADIEIKMLRRNLVIDPISGALIKDGLAKVTNDLTILRLMRDKKQDELDPASAWIRDRNNKALK